MFSGETRISCGEERQDCRILEFASV